MHEGLPRLRDLKARGCCVVGHPEYYRKFGFANTAGLVIPEVPPEVFCEALRQFDEATGLDHYWDDAIYDPWYSTYGMEKTSEWKFETHGDRITEKQIKGLSAASFQLFKEKFGEEMAEEFRKNPIQIFDSLPLDSKRIIMRLANDPQPGPHLTLA